MENVVASFQKNSVEQVRVGLTEYKGKHLVFLREYHKLDEKEWLPTRKGLTLTVSALPDLCRAIRLLVDEAVGLGLVERERFTEDRLSSSIGMVEAWDQGWHPPGGSNLPGSKLGTGVGPQREFSLTHGQIISGADPR